ncbi:MAG: alpha/beta hydrolase [Chloroflexi bacterium]|nr:alpha/beta hydrolase [Chloroflexota bacterium]
MDYITDSTVELNGTTFHYKLSGEDDDTLVFIHAGVADSRSWQQQVDFFAQQSRVLIYDVRGYGQTVMPPNHSYSHHEDLKALLDYLQINTCKIVGMSMGGAIALNFALTHPHMVEAMVLLGSACGGYKLTDPQLEELWEAAGDAFDAGDKHLAAHIEMETWLVGPERDLDDVPRHLREQVIEMILRSYELEEQAEGAKEIPLDPPAFVRLGEIKTPALILVGEDDTEAIKTVSAILHERMAHTKKVVMEDTAHLPNMEKPDEFNRLVLDYLLTH